MALKCFFQLEDLSTKKEHYLNERILTLEAEVQQHQAQIEQLETEMHDRDAMIESLETERDHFSAVCRAMFVSLRAHVHFDS